MAEPVPAHTAKPAGDPRLAIALDVGDLDEALALAQKVRSFFGVAKVGLELYSAAGPDAVAALRELGMAVFCDLKLHDIPTTVRRAAEAVGRTDASYLTIHAAGGEDMLRSGAEGLAATAPQATALAVTVLTSDAHASRKTLKDRTKAAHRAGCGGVVCAAADLPIVQKTAPGLLTVVPGIRPEGAGHHDQARVATPAAALDAGANLLVVGRAVTAAPDPAEAAAELAAAVASTTPPQP